MRDENKFKYSVEKLFTYQFLIPQYLITVEIEIVLNLKLNLKLN